MELPQLIPSPFRIATAAFVLVDYADNGKDYLVADGGPLIKITATRDHEITGFVGAAGKKVFDRGNRSHSISFTAARFFTDASAAFADQLNRTMDLPGARGVGPDFNITMSGYTQTMILRAAVITSTQCGVHFLTEVAIPSAFVSVFEFTLTGGALEGAAFLSGASVNEDGTAQQNEDGTAVAPE